MKKLSILFFVFFLSFVSLSQTEEVKKTIEQSTFMLDREIPQGDHSHLRGRFLSLILEYDTETILDVYHTEGFNMFTKKALVNGEWVNKEILFGDTPNDSLLISIIDEIRKGLPRDIKKEPTKIKEETVVDDYITEYWTYKSRSGKTCEISVHYLNGQIKNISYWIGE